MLIEKVVDKNTIQEYLIRGKKVGLKCADVILPEDNYVINKSIWVGTMIKGVTGDKLSDKELEKIYAQIPNPQDEDVKVSNIFAFPVHLANNIPDRGIERFNEDILQTLSDTSTGKNFLIAHNWTEPGFGTIYDSNIEYAKTVNFQLKNIQIKGQYMQTKVFMRRSGSTLDGRLNDDIIQGMKYGIIKFASIGARIPKIVKVVDDKDNLMFYELQNDHKKGRLAETFEGSFVWLGQQYYAQYDRQMKVLEKELRKGIGFPMTIEQRKKVFSIGDFKLYLDLLGKEVNIEMPEEKVIEEQKKNPMIQDNAVSKTVIIDDNASEEVEDEGINESEESVKEEVKMEVTLDTTDVDKKLDTVLSKFQAVKAEETTMDVKSLTEKVKAQEDELTELRNTVKSVSERVIKVIEVIEKLQESLPRPRGTHANTDKALQDKETDKEATKKKYDIGSGNPMIVSR